MEKLVKGKKEKLFFKRKYENSKKFQRIFVSIRKF